MIAPIPFRIKIGVTGHRNNLPATDKLKEKIRSVIGFKEWNADKAIKPDSIFSLFDENSVTMLRKAKNTPVTFSILTALAEGADRIVAETILEIENSTIEAILPLIDEDYKNDFKSEESKKEFEWLLKLDYHPLRLRSRRLVDQYEQPEIPNRRRQAYFNAGKYIVDHCDVMIAIWDGETPKQKGGTAEVINYANENNCPVIIISSKNPDNIVIPSQNKLNAGAIAQIDFFNNYKIGPENEKKYIDNIYSEYFTKIPESNILNTELLNYLKTDLFPYYAKASTIAKKYQYQYKNSGLLTYWLSTLAVIILGFAVVFKMYYQIAFIVDFILLLTILIIISRAHKIRAHSKWLENRFLVERIRVASYFFISGQEISEISISPYKEQKNESGQWMIFAFSEIWNRLNRQWNLMNNQQKVFQPFSVDLVKYVNKSWVISQIEYHKSNRKSKKWWNNFLELGGKLIFFVAMISAFIHIVIHWSGNENFLSIENPITVLTLSLPMVASAFEGVRRQQEYSRNVRRSEWMLDALKTKSKKYETLAKENIDANDTENEFYKLLKSTDELLLHENQDWILLMIESDLEYVT